MTTKMREIFAAYGGLSAGDLGRIMNDRTLNPVTQAELLATALAMPFKETARAHYRFLVGERGGYARQLKEGVAWLHRLDMEQTPSASLAILPRYSFAISFEFQLAQPYLSKDDDAFYIIDNPVRKDKVFKLPMVAPSSLKGSLRHALWQEGQQDSEQIQRMFGETRDDDTGQSGRLFFYPTFFDRIGLEIINPHDRVRRVGKNPILFECVPEETKGRFTLLYVPFDRIGNEAANPEKGVKSLPEEVAEDMILLAKGLQAMFTLYGFGAKTSSGFGLAKDRVSDGRIQTNVLEAVQQLNPPEEPAMPEALRLFLEQFPDEDFSLKPNEWRKQHGATNNQRKQYMKARSELQQYRQAQEAYQKASAAWEAQAAKPVQSFHGDEFESFSELAKDVAKNLAAKLTAGGEA